MSVIDRCCTDLQCEVMTDNGQSVQCGVLTDSLQIGKFSYREVWTNCTV